MSQLGVGAKINAQVGVQASPGLKLLARLLTLSAQELEQLIAQEIEENPALEWIEDTKISHASSQPVFVSFDSTPSDARELDDDDDFTDSDGDDWLTAPPLELKSHVREQLLLSLPPEQHAIADYLVESLDEHGYLNTEIEEVAMQFNCPLEVVEQVLQQLQQCDPPGVGARNLQECLLIQLEAMLRAPQASQQAPILPIAYQVVKEAWKELSHCQFDRVARRLKLEMTTFQDALQFIREQLVPYPAQGFSVSYPCSRDTEAVEPDIIIRYEKPAGLRVELRGPTPELIRLSQSYAEQYLLVRQRGNATSEEREHIFEYVNRARIFLQALRQRQQTLKHIVEVLVQRQFPFLFTSDSRFLQPMTRAELATATGLHRSTIGRAVRNKWLQLPSGTLVPLDVFFDASYRVALIIQQILDEHEFEGHTLTDAEIAEKLAEMGIHIARRTVSKYRNRHRILCSRWRERARLIRYTIPSYSESEGGEPDDQKLSTEGGTAHSDGQEGQTAAPQRHRARRAV
jgi:RNA polymerase sigma-54 factor